MNEILVYLFKSGLCLVVFYSFYRIFLQHETFFRLNRIYLIGSIFISFMMPIITIHIPSVSDSLPYIILSTINVGELGIESTFRNQVDGWEIILLIYTAVSAILLIRLISQVVIFVFILKKSKSRIGDNSKIVLTNNNTSPFSFFGYIFINENLFSQAEINEIISHEKVHVQQFHSIDILLAELLCIIQWFNPVVWFYKRSIKEIHEYLADAGVLEKGYEQTAYQKLIIGQISAIRSMELANNFSQSLIKRRLKMMKKIKSSQKTSLKYLFTIPAIVLGILIVSSFSYGTFKNEIPDLDVVNNTKVIPSHSEDNDTIYKVVYKNPQFEGGQKGTQLFLVKNIKYPEEARKKGVTGTVYVSFVVEKDGSVTNAEIIRGIGSGCDEEVLRVMKLMPKWVPGEDEDGNKVRVAFALPVKFNLGNDKDDQKAKFNKVDESEQ